MTTYAADTFNRADGPVGSTDTGNYPWVNVPVSVTNSVTWSTGGNQLQSGGSGEGLLVVDDGHSDGIVTATWIAGDAGIVFRCIDKNQWWMVWRPSSPATLKLMRYNSGFTTVATGSTVAASGDVIAVTLSGSSIKVTQNGAQIFNITDSTFSTATRHGLRTSNPGTATGAFDSFSHVSYDFVNVIVPVITGTARSGMTLTASTGTWSMSPDSVTYQWKQAGVAISGATTSTYLITPDVAGTALTVEVTAVKATFASVAATSILVVVQLSLTSTDSTSIVYSPYNWDVTSVRAKTINPGAYLRFGIIGNAVVLNFDMTGVSSPFPILKYRVDGAGWVTATLTATVTLTIPADNTWAKHVVEVVVSATSQYVTRWTPQNAAVVLTGIATGSLFDIRPRTKKVLVFGDSITEGYKALQNLATPNGSDTTVAWSYLIGGELGVEVGVVGFGGQAWTTAGQGGVPGLTTSYNLLWSGQARTFAPAPDAILVNMGENGTTVTATVVSWITALLAVVPSTTKILIMRPFSGRSAAALLAAVTTVASRRVTYVDTAGWWSSVDSTDGQHPNGYASIAQLASRTADAIRAVIAPPPKRYINVAGAAVSIQ